MSNRTHLPTIDPIPARAFAIPVGAAMFIAGAAAGWLVGVVLTLHVASGGCFP